MKTYRFECYDSEESSTTVVEFTTENDAWSGFDGPMHKFFNFLKGCGFVFNLEDDIGVVRVYGDTHTFVGATDND